MERERYGKFPGYQYEKFFDAMAVANRDKWQRADAADTSFKPFAWIRTGILEPVAEK